ncbi:MAG TPA: aminoglycoside phosphotransferase family protein [Candidatus Limnocylindrales bacterium]|nr:aminoglycoside phosphotransferase family protein [Candidatus Limnocylindrales bacterium]
MTHPSPWLDEPPYGLAEHVVARLKRIAEGAARAWGVPLGPRIATGRYSYVAFAGEDAVLKVIPEEDDQAAQTVDALRLWQGDGAVRLLKHDTTRRVMLLERVRPGTEASAVGEDEAIAAAIAVGRRIWVAPPKDHAFRAIATLVERWLDGLPAHALTDTARSLFADIRPRAEVVVHADFHHHNLLLRAGEWVTIDPQPHIGEPEFDVPAFLWNPLSTVATPERTRERIAAFARAGLDAERIRRWTIIRGVCNGLSSGNTEPTAQLRVAQQLL